jgi:uncharacterized Zn finger protein (UPF0148 family)
MFAKHPEMAKEWAAKTNYKKLPEHKAHGGEITCPKCNHVFTREHQEREHGFADELKKRGGRWK